MVSTKRILGRLLYKLSYVRTLPEIIEEGGFTLDPDGNITVNVSFIPENSSLTFVRNLTTTESSHLILNKPSVITSGNMNKEPAERVLIPAKFPIAGDKNNTIILKLEPNSSEEYMFRYSAKEPVTELLICFDTSNSDINHNCIEAGYISQIGINLSDYKILSNISMLPRTGFNLINSTTKISSDCGDVRISYDKAVSEYRYEFTKVSVEVTSEDGTEYDIHYWAIVT